MPGKSQGTPYVRWLRGLVGRRKILLACASLVLRDVRGRALLLRGAGSGAWGLPSGVLQPGESILDCALRELFEATGLAAKTLKLGGVYTDPRYDFVSSGGSPVQPYTVCFQGQLNANQNGGGGLDRGGLVFFEPADLPFAGLSPISAAMLRDALWSDEPTFLPPYTHPNTVNPVEEFRPLIGQALYIGVGAQIAVVRDDGCLLLVRRCDDGYWSLPGGYMHLGENVAYTALRETLEETGLQVALERILGVMSPIEPWVYPNGDQTQTVVTVFRARPLSDAPHPDHLETSQVAWMHPREALALETHPTLERLNRAVVEHLETGTFVI